MRFIRLLSVVFLGLTLCFTSCTKEEDNGNIALSSGSNTFVANLDGEAWSASRKEALLEGNKLSVYGESSNGSLISVKVKLFKYEPTDRLYVLNNHSNHFISYDPSLRSDSLVYWSKNNPGTHGDVNSIEFQNSGEVTITKLDKVNQLVSGKFKVRVYNNHDNSDYYQISQGTFTDIAIVEAVSIDLNGAITNHNGDEDNDTGGDIGDIVGDDDDDNVLPQYLNCDIDGQALNTNAPIVSFNYGSITITNNVVVDYQVTQSLKLEIPTSLEIGSYVFSETSPRPQVSYTIDEEVYASTDALLSEITITEKTEEKISGTFVSTIQSASGEDTKSITNGSFSINLLQ